MTPMIVTGRERVGEATTVGDSLDEERLDSQIFDDELGVAARLARALDDDTRHHRVVILHQVRTCNGLLGNKLFSNRGEAHPERRWVWLTYGDHTRRSRRRPPPLFHGNVHSCRQGSGDDIDLHDPSLIVERLEELEPTFSIEDDDHDIVTFGNVFHAAISH